MLLYVIKKPHKVVTNNEGNNTSTNLQRKELKISWLHKSLYICNVSDWSLPMKETQYTWLVSQNVKAWKIVLYCKFNKSEGISCILHQQGQAQLLKKKTGRKSVKKNSGKVAKFVYLVVQTCKCSPKKCPQHVFLFLKLFANIWRGLMIRYPFVIIVQQRRKKITIETCYRKWLAGTNRA